MGLEPAVTDLEQLKDHPALALLLPWNAGVVTQTKFDRNELSVYIDRANIKEACSVLKRQFNFFSDLTCVDWYPSEPRYQRFLPFSYHDLLQALHLSIRCFN